MRIAGIAEEQALRDDPREQRPVARVLRAFLAARSRFAEDRLARAIDRGTRQYVVLGAGLDTFAYRHPYGGDLTVFEVDYPATQSWKRGRLADAGIVIPPSVRYVAVDFEGKTPLDGLAAAGFDVKAPAFFSWLGEIGRASCRERMEVLAWWGALQ